MFGPDLLSVNRGAPVSRPVGRDVSGWEFAVKEVGAPRFMASIRVPFLGDFPYPSTAGSKRKLAFYGVADWQSGPRW